MIIELFGGPEDGKYIEVPDQTQEYLVQVLRQWHPSMGDPPKPYIPVDTHSYRWAYEWRRVGVGGYMAIFKYEGVEYHDNR